MGRARDCFATNNERQSKIIAVKHMLFFITAFVVLTAAQCRVGLVPDPAMAAVEAGDKTALIEGCGNQLVSGYTYCRITEGDATGQSLTFVAPPTICERDACVFFKVFFPTGEPSYEDSVTRGETRKEIPWSMLLKRETFEKSDRGFWPFVYTIYWLDKEGNEQITISEGEIRLRVLDAGYQALHESKKNPNFVWKWKHDGVDVGMTTGARTHVGRK